MTTIAGERVSKAWVFVITCAMVIAALYFLIPVAWLVIASTKSTGQLFSTPGFAFADFHLFDNLIELSTYDNGIFWRWSLNSIIYSIVGSALTTLVCAATGYALALYRFRGRNVLLAVVLASLLVPGTVIAQPTYVLLVSMGLNNTYAGLLLPALVYPFGVLLCFIYAQSSVPNELVEAARLDGAGEFRIFLSIGLRLMMTGMVTVLLFAFLSSWNNYILPLLVLTDQELMPVTVGLTGWGQSAVTIPGLQTLTVVGSLVSVIPIAIVFVALQRFWRSGLTAGGIRG
ncbi:multiple sugar transport system permease protein [Microbacterium halimionae]|uniref:Multiple sugar transport system permease protein n=1 Tax=Microbacterium halimionae TaxID=1526413 RepID=A0A7W3PM29_9MICO|nr:carbohydrate ABC transporter permease [Microbacterium halimionae]MBA8817170.1 multiple sugar transport system permease protein [Microbacterium halimionae]NII94620.1 multiple sugar transport system permease protein [Microbacterium halimionae]